MSLPTLPNLNVGKLILTTHLNLSRKKIGAFPIKWSISNKTAAIKPRRDAMNWFAACGCSFI
jgi:hypothetical protein